MSQLKNMIKAVVFSILVSFGLAFSVFQIIDDLFTYGKIHMPLRNLVQLYLQGATSWAVPSGIDIVLMFRFGDFYT